jgi:trehalose 6-phosphate phosphatase
MNDVVDTPLPKLPHRIEECAFLLDVDGTILDLAPTPREVYVSKELRQTLQKLYERTGGATAFVSGRPVEELDLIFAPLQLPAVGGHGCEFRLTPDGPTQSAMVTPLPSKIKRRFAMIAEAAPGIIVEDKKFSIALHYRLAPDMEDHVRKNSAALCEELDLPLELLLAKSVVEIKQSGFNKATAVRDIMQHAPFAGRLPVFVGDDTTDEPVFPVIPEFGGMGFSVGRRIPGVPGHFDRPRDVRRWLEILAVGTTP